MKISNKKVVAMLLSVAMAFNMAVPAVAQGAETLLADSSFTEAGSPPQGNSTEDATVVITAFVPLAADIEKQIVAVGTLQENLALPIELKALTAQENAQPKEITLTGIQWQLLAEYNKEIIVYNPDVNGSYVFTPIIPTGYTLAEGEVLPQITVTVGAVGAMNGISIARTNSILGITVSGGTLDSDYTFSNTTKTITVNTSTALTFSGTATETVNITVARGVTANITLDNLSIINNNG
ncbi:MAG: hypothetical protein RR087_09875, partial [Oscillospiraceae bacterium]